MPVFVVAVLILRHAQAVGNSDVSCELRYLLTEEIRQRITFL